MSIIVPSVIELKPFADAKAALSRQVADQVSALMAEASKGNIFAMKKIVAVTNRCDRLQKELDGFVRAIQRDAFALHTGGDELLDD